MLGPTSLLFRRQLLQARLGQHISRGMASGFGEGVNPTETIQVLMDLPEVKHRLDAAKIPHKNPWDILNSSVSLQSLIASVSGIPFRPEQQITASPAALNRFYYGEKLRKVGAGKAEPVQLMTSRQAGRAIELTRGTSLLEGAPPDSPLQCIAAKQKLSDFDPAKPDKAHKAGEISRVSFTTEPSVAMQFAFGRLLGLSASSAIISADTDWIPAKIMVKEDARAYIEGIHLEDTHVPVSFEIDPNSDTHGGEAEISLPGVLPIMLFPFRTASWGPLLACKAVANSAYIDPAVALTNPYLLEGFGQIMDMYQTLAQVVDAHALSRGTLPIESLTEEQVSYLENILKYQSTFQLSYQRECSMLDKALSYEQTQRFRQEMTKLSAESSTFSGFQDMYMTVFDRIKNELKIESTPKPILNTAKRKEGDKGASSKKNADKVNPKGPNTPHNP